MILPFISSPKTGCDCSFGLRVDLFSQSKALARQRSEVHCCRQPRIKFRKSYLVFNGSSPIITFYRLLSMLWPSWQASEGEGNGKQTGARCAWWRGPSLKRAWALILIHFNPFPPLLRPATQAINFKAGIFFALSLCRRRFMKSQSLIWVLPRSPLWPVSFCRSFLLVSWTGVKEKVSCGFQRFTTKTAAEFVSIFCIPI